MTPRPVLLCLHGLGAAGRSWRGLCEAYGGPCDAPDLPGFGGAAPLARPTLDAYADWTVARLARVGGPVVLVGWSMGGKFALAAAARRPERLAGLVLLAPSPPGGEPMNEGERTAMIADGPTSENAAKNADDNTGSPPPAPVRDEAVDDWLASDPATFRWWFAAGSREIVDVSTVGVPVLILGGDQDDKLGASEQARLTAAHLDRVQVQALPGVGHLVPREAPRSTADRVTAWVDGL